MWHNLKTPAEQQTHSLPILEKLDTTKKAKNSIWGI